MMNFSNVELEVRELVRRVARERVAARAGEIDRSAQYPQDMFDLLKELGLFALPYPERYGGMNSMTASCLAIEEFGRVCYNTAYLLVVQWDQFAVLLEGVRRSSRKSICRVSRQVTFGARFL